MNEHLDKPLFKGEVLLCEDNNMNQELICSRLAKMGLTTITAQNGKEGIEKVEYRIKNGIKPFDLIFMDIYMPIMNGIETARKIGTLNTGTPIVAMTANSTPADREKYASEGMYDCLNKPFSMTELLHCLVKYMTPVRETAPPDIQDDEKLTLKLIHIFVRKNNNICDAINQAVHQNDITLAHRLAHTLKGQAGLFGKTRLQEAAKNVEELLENNKNRLNTSAMNALKTELDAVLAEFAPLAAEKESDLQLSDGETETGIAVDNERIQLLFAELESLLDGGDVKCLHLVDRLRLISGTGELIQQIEDYEFDRAMKTLEQLKKGG